MMLHTVQRSTLIFLALVAPLAAQAPANPSPLRAVTRTLYSEKTELFAEFRPLIVGQTTRLTAHLTRLGESFRARSEGKVSLTLSVDDAVVQARTGAPERPGVFRLMVTPTKPGRGRVVIDCVFADSSEHFVLEDVPVFADTDAALAKQTSAEKGLISWSKEKQWDADFATAPVQKQGTMLLIPASAVIREQGSTSVYVQKTPEAFELRTVKTATSQGANIAISEGLREEDRVVTRGTEKLPRK